MKRTCKQCGREFELSDSEIRFYKSRGLELPRRCQSCRDQNKKHRGNAGQKGREQTPAGTDKGSGQSHTRVDKGKEQTPTGTDNSTDRTLQGSAGNGSRKNAVIIAAAAVILFLATFVIKNIFSIPTENELPSTDFVPAGIAQTEEQESADGALPDMQPSAEAAPDTVQEASDVITYEFRRAQYLTEHFEKHGAEFSYTTEEEYLAGANNVIQNPEALHKLEAEDGDDVYYVEGTGEFVVVSTDGYIRTYFKADLDYYNRQ